MPYMIVVSHWGKGSERTWEPTGIVFNDGAQSGQYVKEENAYSSLNRVPRRYRALKISDDDPLLWREREQRKFEEGIYRRVPWSDHYGGTGMYEHINPDDATKVRFIASDEDGLSGRYTSMSPGRFLHKYVDSCINNDCLDTWCAQMGLNETTSKLLIARSTEEIIRVYNEGPHSCMSYPYPHDNFQKIECHPVSVYGDSDVGVAYIERYEEITARCLVWPDAKKHGRIYGDKKRLLERLKENDYIEDWDFTGARVRLLTNANPELLIVPYIDGDNMGLIQIDESWLSLSNKPHIIAKNQWGYADAAQCDTCGTSGVWIERWFGPDGDYEEPEYRCAEGCKK